VPDDKQTLLQGFKAFILRDNVLDLAVAVVIGLAFKAVVDALVKDLITPIVSIPGKTNFAALHFGIRHSVFAYGDFINTVISFVTIAAAVFFFVVRPMDQWLSRLGMRKDPDTPTKECPECLTAIPVAARRCSACTSPQPA
jgi:large conductance mechanosensitive channel